MPHIPPQGMDQALQRCIEQCLETHAVCLDTIRHCLQMRDRYATQEHVTTLLDCAEISQTASSYLLRGSALHAGTCALCAEVCTACAVDCESLGEDDRMRVCAESCRRCADACRKMAGGTRVAHAA
jgi:hypothetical protein